MLYVVLVLLLFITCLLIKSPKNKYAYFLTMMTVSLIGMIITSITLWKYDYPDMWIFKFDYKLMLKISSASSWKHYATQNFFNFTMIMYMASIQLFDYDIDKIRGAAGKYCKKIIFIVFSAAYLIFYNSETALDIYIKLNSGLQSETLRQWVSFANVVIVSAQTFYFMYPSARLLFAIKGEKFWPKQRRMLIFGIYVLIMNIFVLCFFVFGPLKNNYSGFSANTLLGMRDFFRVNIYHYISLVMLLCLFVLCILYFIFKKQIFFTFASLRRNLFQNRWKINDDTREIFHMLKNVMFRVEAMAKQGLLDDNAADKDMCLKMISDVCEKKINDFFEITSMSKRTSYNIKAVQVYEIINAALEKYPLGNDITLKYDYMAAEDWVYVDFLCMTETIVNILKNAAESFETIERDEKIIRIEVCDEQDMIGINITDNGKGIDKKELKRIFRPFYTTKNRGKNWGIGLSFVYKTVLSHYGHIKINSEEGKGTCVSIILYKKEAL